MHDCHTPPTSIRPAEAMDGEAAELRVSAIAGRRSMHSKVAKNSLLALISRLRASVSDSTALAIGLIRLGDFATAVQHTSGLETVAENLRTLSLQRAQDAADYYQALVAGDFGRGNQSQATKLLEQVING